MQQEIVYLLIAALLCVSLLLVGLSIWTFLLGGSIRAIAMALLGMLFNRGSTIDPEAPIVVARDERLSDVLMERADSLKDKSSAQQAQAASAPRVQQAVLPPQERGPAATTTSDNGWPVPLDEKAQRDPRPFRHIRLQTDHDEDPDAPQS